MNLTKQYLLLDNYEKMRDEIQNYTKYIFPPICEIHDTELLIEYFKLVFSDELRDKLTLYNILLCDDISLSCDEFYYVLDIIKKFLRWFRENYI
jgi:hypothetical protein